jgi:hypothetical protein
MGMREVITYSDKPVTPKLLAKWKSKVHELKDDKGKKTGKVKLKAHTDVPKQRNGAHSVGLMRCKESDLWEYDEDGNQVAGWLQDVFTLCTEIADVSQGESAWDMITTEGETLINLAYNREYINEDGEKCLKPKCFGRFM